MVQYLITTISAGVGLYLFFFVLYRLSLQEKEVKKLRKELGLKGDSKLTHLLVYLMGTLGIMVLLMLFVDDTITYIRILYYPIALYHSCLYLLNRLVKRKLKRTLELVHDSENL